MDLQQRINAFVKLGEFIGQFANKDFKKSDNVAYNDLCFDGFSHQIKLAEERNGWFTKDNIAFALDQWHKLLTDNSLKDWISAYSLGKDSDKTIAVISAGNIPLVGFHDIISVLITGHNILIKQSSNDKQLLPFLMKYLVLVEPEFKGKISFTENRLENFDAVIATGSNNTARYFEYYFKNKPSIIRKNRNSVAILTGNETDSELKALSEDIFRYYGLGCRNVSKLFIPENYDFDAFFKAIYDWHPIIQETKYANNYDYNKAVYLMSEFEILENGFLMLKEDTSFASPIATLFYETYGSKEDLRSLLETNAEQIQCIVANGFSEKEIKFGNTQLPSLSDYADGVDTITFSLTMC